ncbi:hypothetical protein HBA55_34585 [Pseudomaricurvus alkylphenolicus]|uniref:hypothetical protein n=1 Tax=Pseudomaricurvus alkylphenolicus TaxID=1306991 RepID=UPI001420FCCA|nr:hypothetical protein [Pseudomaricurvus alkylphenolicus]NIB44759.1 hypothetical protein [Pseudomaricurvus alkylphenolicus]
MSDRKNKKLSGSYWFRAVAAVGVIICLIMLRMIYLKDLSHRPVDYSSEGWMNLFNMLQPVIMVAGGTIVILGIIATLHRSKQAAQQIELALNSKGADLHQKHRDSLIEHLKEVYPDAQSQMTGSSLSVRFNPFKLYSALFSAEDHALDAMKVAQFYDDELHIKQSLGKVYDILSNQSEPLTLSEQEKLELKIASNNLHRISKRWHGLIETRELKTMTLGEACRFLVDASLMLSEVLYFESKAPIGTSNISVSINRIEKLGNRVYGIGDCYLLNFVDDLESGIIFLDESSEIKLFIEETTGSEIKIITDNPITPSDDIRRPHEEVERYDSGKILFKKSVKNTKEEI